MVLEDPHKNVIRSFHRSSSDEVTVDVAVGGIYKVSYSDSFKTNFCKKNDLRMIFSRNMKLNINPGYSHKLY